MAGAPLRACGKHGNLPPMRRFLAIAGLFLVLTGCGGSGGDAPFTDSRIPPALGPRFWAPEGWAWGLVGVGEAPVQRYGVSSTLAAPRGNILILADDRELAEAWFETARDLNTRGYSVWVLERAGQGGSARYSGPRDLIHAPSFDDDAAATKALARNIVGADADTPLTIVGQGVGGLIALRAVQTGAPAAALVLSAPRLKPEGPLPAWPTWLMNLGVGRLPSGLGDGWSRDGPDDFKAGKTRDHQRGAVQLAWQTANPDLRMGRHSMGWTSAFAAAGSKAVSGAADVKTPTLLIALRVDAKASSVFGLCDAIADCSARALHAPPHLGAFDAKTGVGLYMERDAARTWWLRLIDCATPEHPRIPRPATETCPG